MAWTTFKWRERHIAKNPTFLDRCHWARTGEWWYFLPEKNIKSSKWGKLFQMANVWCLASCVVNLCTVVIMDQRVSRIRGFSRCGHGQWWEWACAKSTGSSSGPCQKARRTKCCSYMHGTAAYYTTLSRDAPVGFCFVQVQVLTATNRVCFENAYAIGSNYLPVEPYANTWHSCQLKPL